MADPFIGEIRLFGFPRVPDGWLACSGQSVSIGQYEALYTLIGTTYGGDGVQTFQLPDLRGRVPIGQGGTFVVGQNAGEEQHSLTNMEIPAHSHGLMSSTTTATAVTPGSSLHLATASRPIFMPRPRVPRLTRSWLPRLRQLAQACPMTT